MSEEPSISLYGPDGVLARFVQAADKIHVVAERCRAVGAQAKAERSRILRFLRSNGHHAAADAIEKDPALSEAGRGMAGAR